MEACRFWSAPPPALDLKSGLMDLKSGLMDTMIFLFYSISFLEAFTVPFGPPCQKNRGFSTTAPTPTIVVVVVPRPELVPVRGLHFIFLAGGPKRNSECFKETN